MQVCSYAESIKGNQMQAGFKEIESNIWSV